MSCSWSTYTTADAHVTCVQAMCCDYGFRSGVGRLYQGSTGEVPKNFFALVCIALKYWLPSTPLTIASKIVHR